MATFTVIRKQAPMRIYKRKVRYSWFGPDGRTRHEEYSWGKWGAWCRVCHWGDGFVVADQGLALERALVHLEQRHPDR